MSERPLSQVQKRRRALQWTSAIVLGGFLLNAAVVLIFVAGLSSSILPLLVAVALMAGIILVAGLLGDSVVLRGTWSRPLGPGEYPWLEPMVNELSEKAGIPAPEVRVTNEDGLNAFAVGTGARAKVVFTEELLHRLRRDEVYAVAAHEVGHHVNRDVGLGIWTIAVFRWVTFAHLVIHCAARLVKGFGEVLQDQKDRDTDVVGALTAVVGFMITVLAQMVIALAWIWAFIAALMQLAISRRREYLADATAVALTGQPHQLARALATIAQDPDIRANRDLQHFCIMGAAGESWIDGLLSTHPPIERRIEEIEGLPAEEVELDPADGRAIGWVALAFPAGAIASLALLAVLLPLVVTSGGDDRGSYAAFQPASGTSGGQPASRPAVLTSPTAARSGGQQPTPTATPPLRPTATPTPTATPISVAGALASGNVHEGSISATDQRDRWTFAAREGDIITVRVMQRAGASLKPRFDLLDPSGAVERFDGGACTNDAGILNHRVKFTGQYTVLVHGACNTIGGYSLEFRVKPEPQPLVYGSTAAGLISIPRDYAEFRFSGKAGDVITIQANPSGGASLGPFIVLLDSSGAQEADTNRAVCKGPATLLNHRLRFDGDYTIRVEGGCGTTGGFSVALVRKPPPQRLTHGQSAVGVVRESRDYAAFEFEATAGDVVTIQATGTDGLLPNIELLDPSGSREARTNVASCSPTAQIRQRQLRFTGTYTIRIEGGCSSAGTVSVTLTQP